uniref:non-specific serine/threonine protein kinase n=1 Tax=Schizophyllum commune (strain H4-8 / FGSC 9210) TaxID=578458 RepID=D8PXV4_SCHCM
MQKPKIQRVSIASPVRHLRQHESIRARVPIQFPIILRVADLRLPSSPVLPRISMFALTLPSSQLGRVLAGRYTLEKTLGKGSFGSVIRALDRATSSTVAVKVQKKYTKDSTMEIRQRREQSLHSKVSEHPNVVTFLHAFETPDAACIVLQYVPDGDLCSAIEKRSYYGDGPLISHCFDQLLDAVAFCHARGVYHRDIKPENILVSGDRRTWYLTDFGLATPNRTSSGAGIGTHSYMAPEVLGSPEFSRAVIWNTAADVWALGITLLAVLNSALPWPRAERKEKKFAAYLANPAAVPRQHHAYILRARYPPL